MLYVDTAWGLKPIEATGPHCSIWGKKYYICRKPHSIYPTGIEVFPEADTRDIEGTTYRRTNYTYLYLKED